MLHSCDAARLRLDGAGLGLGGGCLAARAAHRDIYPYVLDVRDLATGYMVESRPLLHADAETVGGHLWRLYDIRSPAIRN